MLPSSVPFFPGSLGLCFRAIYNDVYEEGRVRSLPVVRRPMTFRYFRVFSLSAAGTILLAASALAQTRPAPTDSPYGGTVVEDILARVNDQIISRTDYDRALKELDDESRQHGLTMQQMSEQHKDLLRNLIDQQLWLSKGKELGITGETELVNRLNEIRKQYNLQTIEELEKAAQEQGASYEDFKANIRNQIVTQEVMRQEVGRHVNMTPGEAMRFYDAHKQEYAQPESVTLSEILVSTGTPAPAPEGGVQSDDPAKVTAAKAKADDLETKLKSGADFADLARNSSDGQTAAQGGNLGTYKRGQLNKVFEDQVFNLKTGDVTDPTLTKQGYVIFKVDKHISGGVPEFKDVEQQVEQDYWDSKMMPAIRDYLTKMREDAYVEVKPGFTDTGASGNQRVLPISYASYTPPSPKKKKKVERTRFRETTHTFRNKSPQAAAPAEEAATPAAAPAAAGKKDAKKEKAAADSAIMKPGKKEKIRFGQAPTKTLPTGPETPTEDAGGPAPQVAQSNEPANPLEEAPAPEKKTRFSARAKIPKEPKAKGFLKADPTVPAAPGAAEVADRQTQGAPLGLAGDTASKKKKKGTTTEEKTRLSDKKKEENQEPGAPAPAPTPIPAVPGAPAPSQTPAPAPQPQQ
jgi:peptidyl-prolyl cis-trans isomerase SurA